MKRLLVGFTLLLFAPFSLAKGQGLACEYKQVLDGEEIPRAYHFYIDFELEEVYYHANYSWEWEKLDDVSIDKLSISAYNYFGIKEGSVVHSQYKINRMTLELERERTVIREKHKMKPIYCKKSEISLEGQI